jgi:hypothetical protein
MRMHFRIAEVAHGLACRVKAGAGDFQARWETGVRSKVGARRSRSLG